MQSIALVAYLKESRKVNGPHLILVPKSVLGNWAREFAKFAPSIRVFKLQAADKEERLRMVRQCARSHTSLRRWLCLEYIITLTRILPSLSLCR